MRRSDGEVDLEAIDALLGQLGEELDEAEHFEAVALTGPLRSHAASSAGEDWDYADVAGVQHLDIATPPTILSELPDPSELLPPLCVPPGYVLDGRGVLRYQIDGDTVPGARLLTLARRFRFERSAGLVWVPAWLCSRLAELRWVTDPDVAAAPGSVRSGAGTASAWGVEEALWDHVAAHPYAVWAPELCAEQMWDLGAVATALGVTPQTVSTYLARAQMPQPQARAGNSPLWSPDIIWRWESLRPGQGRAPRQTRRRRSHAGRL